MPIRPPIIPFPVRPVDDVWRPLGMVANNDPPPGENLRGLAEQYQAGLEQRLDPGVWLDPPLPVGPRNPVILDGPVFVVNAEQFNALAAPPVVGYNAGRQVLMAAGRGGGKKIKNDEAERGEGQVPGKMLNLDRRFGHTKNRIAKVGIEVEGGWTSLPDGIKQANHDGSVFKAGLPAHCPLLVAKGEIASPPIEPVLLGSWVRKHHPQVVDPSCGLHIHMGFKRAEYYSSLMDSPNYQATIVGYLKKWAEQNNIPDEHCVWDRLSGENKYCRNLFWPELQVAKSGKEHDVEREGNKRGHRYTIVNYCWGLGFETLEIRVLPMFDKPALSVSALKMVVDVTNAYLAEVAPKGLETRQARKFKAGLTLREDESPVQKKRVLYV